MMEKQNRVIEKRAAGDARDIDDLVDGAAVRFAKKETPGASGHRREGDKDTPELLCR